MLTWTQPLSELVVFHVAGTLNSVVFLERQAGTLNSVEPLELFEVCSGRSLCEWRFTHPLLLCSVQLQKRGSILNGLQSHVKAPPV